MEMNSFIYGLLVSGAVIGLILLIRWIVNHTNTVAQLKQDVKNVENGMENAHKYLDSRVQDVSTDVRTAATALHERIDNNVDDLHRRMDGEVNVIHQKIDNNIESISKNVEEQAKMLHDRVDEVQTSMAPKAKGK